MCVCVCVPVSACVCVCVCVYSYENPLVVLPGDELKMTCEFSSMNRRHTTKYGPGSHEEMCFGLITYFPKQAWIPRSLVCLVSFTYLYAYR